MKNSSITREEERKARARAANARHIANVQKQKEWLAANPHIISQQEREKEERRKNFETIRMIVKDEPEKKQKKTSNAFAAFCESDSEMEEEQEQKKEKEKEEPVTVTEKEKMPVFNTKRFIWADEDD